MNDERAREIRRQFKSTVAARERCSEREFHTPAPSGYVEWQDWAVEMGRTHEQRLCEGCGLWVIWEEKTP